MSSDPLGKPTSAVEVTNISSYGVWLLAHGTEMFMSYDDFLGSGMHPLEKY